MDGWEFEKVGEVLDKCLETKNQVFSSTVCHLVFTLYPEIDATPRLVRKIITIELKQKIAMGEVIQLPGMGGYKKI